MAENSLPSRSRSARPNRLGAYAIAGSLVLHSVLVAGFMIQRANPVALLGDPLGRVESGPATDGVSTISVTLVAANAATQSAARALPQAAPADALQSLMTKAMDRAPIAAAGPGPARPTSLDDLIASADRAANPKKTRDGGAAAPGGQAGATAAADGSSRDLFGQAEPCWRRALGASTVPVTLEISLDGAGRFAGAPKVDFTAAGDGDARRVSVERALQAIFACLPYRVSKGRGVYRVAFGVSAR